MKFVLSDVVVTFRIRKSVVEAAAQYPYYISAAADLANIGNVTSYGTSDGRAGVVPVTVAANSGALKIAGSNTTQGTQTATNTVAVTKLFYVTADPDGTNVKVYSSVTSPPPGTPPPNGAVPGRTGTLVTGDLSMPVAVDGHRVGTTATAGATVWTPTGAGSVNFAQASTPQPSSTTVPTNADRSVAPLRMSAGFGFVNVSYSCWPGIVTGGTYVPGAPLIFATAYPPAYCGLGAGIPGTLKNQGRAEIRGGLIPTESFSDTRWKNSGTIENCTGGLPVSPKYNQVVSGGSFKLQVTLTPGSDCTDIIGGAVTRSSLSLKWTTVVAGKARTAGSDKVKTGITFTRSPGDFPITLNAVIPPITNTKSLFYGRHFEFKMVMDQTAGQVSTACAGPGGLAVLNFTGAASVLTIV